jgi:predicted Zn finger-like uncharacterized protein
MMDIVCPTCAAAYEIDEATVTDAGRKVRCAACSTIWRVYPVAMNTAIEPSFAVETGANPYATEPSEDIFGEGGPMLRQALEEQASHIDEPKTQDIVENDIVSAAAIDAMDETLATQEIAIDSTATQTMTAAVEHEEAQEIPRAKLRLDRTAQASGKSKTKASASFLNWKTTSIAATFIVLGVGLHQRETIVKHVPQTANLYANLGMPVNLRGIEIRNVASRIIDDNGVNILVIDGDLINLRKQKVDLPRLRFAVRGNDGQEVYVWSAQADKNNLEPGESLNFRRRLAAPPNDGKDISVRFLTRADTTAGIK